MLINPDPWIISCFIQSWKLISTPFLKIISTPYNILYPPQSDTYGTTNHVRRTIPSIRLSSQEHPFLFYFILLLLQSQTLYYESIIFCLKECVRVCPCGCLWSINLIFQEHKLDDELNKTNVHTKFQGSCNVPIRRARHYVVPALRS